MDKKQLTERDICTKFINPALDKAGWDHQTQVCEEFPVSNGRIIVRGSIHTRARRADYALQCKKNMPIYWFVNCNLLREKFASTYSGINVRHTSPSKVSAGFFPVPDLEDQKAIAEKVDELIGLCEQPSKRLNQVSETRFQMAETVVEQAIS